MDKECLCDQMDRNTMDNGQIIAWMDKGLKNIQINLYIQENLSKIIEKEMENINGNNKNFCNLNKHNFINSQTGKMEIY